MQTALGRVSMETSGRLGDPFKCITFYRSQQGKTKREEILSLGHLKRMWKRDRKCERNSRVDILRISYNILFGEAISPLAFGFWT